MVIRSSEKNLSDRAARILSNNLIVIIKCDTIYGIVGAAPETEEKIRQVKKRDRQKSFILLIPRASWIKRFSDQVVPPLLKRYWPGPLTIILEGRGGGTVAFRVPKDKLLLTILKKLKKPIFSTSVNESNEEPLNRIDEIIKRYENKVDCIVDSGDAEDAVPSTIIDACSRPYKIIRQGALLIPPDVLQ
jgi:L-threonylcarbamoyladenylate synthase